MNRLTEKVELFNGANTFRKNNIVSNQELVIKLGQLEDIEEELSIDLLTLFKVLKNGVYVKETQYSRHSDYIGGASLGFGHNGFYYYDAKNRFWNIFFKDYGKTWALTKGELENGTK